MPTWSGITRRLILSALEEDLGTAGDITSALLGGEQPTVSAHVVPRAAGVICGLAVAPAICECFAEHFGEAIEFQSGAGDDGDVTDGDRVDPGRRVGSLRGGRSAILATERTLLNFIGRMSGVASLTRRFVDAAHALNANVNVLDTRKTLPGWRELDKYAVRCGGGTNHRFGLHDAILIKDNHLAGIPLARLAASLGEQLRNAPAAAQFVEVEVDSLEQLAEVLRVPGVDFALLDNFSLDQMRAAVEMRNAAGLTGKVALEASGNVTLGTIGGIAGTGVDRISVGALTHSAVNFDVGLDIVT